MILAHQDAGWPASLRNSHQTVLPTSARYRTATCWPPRPPRSCPALRTGSGPRAAAAVGRPSSHSPAAEATGPWPRDRHPPGRRHVGQSSTPSPSSRAPRHPGYRQSDAVPSTSGPSVGTPRYALGRGWTSRRVSPLMPCPLRLVGVQASRFRGPGQLTVLAALLLKCCEESRGDARARMDPRRSTEAEARPLGSLAGRRRGSGRRS
jgi:hypothetical protein